MTTVFPPPTPPSMSLWAIGVHMLMLALALGATFGLFRKGPRPAKRPCLACGCGLNDRGRFQTLFNAALYLVPKGRESIARGVSRLAPLAIDSRRFAAGPVSDLCSTTAQVLTMGTGGTIKSGLRRLKFPQVSNLRCSSRYQCLWGEGWGEGCAHRFVRPRKTAVGGDLDRS